MYHEVVWSNKTLENFLKYGNLSEDEKTLITMRSKDLTIRDISIEIDRSEATVSRMVEKLKRKYDICVKDYPELFTERKIKRHYLAKYDNFSGVFKAKSKSLGTRFIDFENQSFNGLKEVKTYIIDKLEESFDNYFEDLGEIELNINMNLKLKIDKK